MDKSIKNLVIKPKTYLPQGKAFPTLYLLHGAYGQYDSWLNKVPELQTFADTYEMLIVCPDGEKTSWYFDSPVDKKMKYETYISQELVQWMDQHYNTIPKQQGRAITGLSMGGHGAFYLAFRHQDIWGAAGSMSGGVDIRPFPKGWDLAKRLGTYAQHPDNWETNTVINLLYLLNDKSLKLIFDCGTDDFFYEVNKNLHKKMVERNIPHDYIERPGAHNWEYWRNAIKYQLLYFDNFFKRKE
ncbi:alpha/beta hydrolase family protein [Rapidithrix thailandica]|uniref:Alpha/beta hydrolase family protein n=1 Tax=Rapidithrix thailandica TaxID=413964 RepID=A0AAW9RRW1_9BACT